MIAVDEIVDKNYYSVQDIASILGIATKTLYNRKILDSVPEEKGYKINLFKTGKLKKRNIRGDAVKKFILDIA